MNQKEQGLMAGQDLWSMRTVVFGYFPLYLLMVGILYLWGFWSTYHVNVLEHAGISDVVKAAAQPVTSGFIFWIVGGLLGLGLQVPAAPVNSNSGSRFKIQRQHIIVFFGFAVLGVAVYMTSYVYLSILLPVMAVRLAQKYIPSHVMSRQIPAEVPRRFTVWTLMALPCFAFAQGLIQADLIRGGRVFQYLASPIEMVEGNLQSASDSPRLLGRIGGHLFFYMPPNEDLVIVRADLVPVLHLRRFNAGIRGRFGRAEKPTEAATASPLNATPATGLAPTPTESKPLDQ